MKTTLGCLVILGVLVALAACSKKPEPPLAGGVYRVAAWELIPHWSWGGERVGDKKGRMGYEIRKVLSSDENDYVYVSPERGRWFEAPPDAGMAKALDWGRSVRQGREPLKSFAELKPVLLYVANAAEVKAQRTAQAPIPSVGEVVTKPRQAVAYAYQISTTPPAWKVFHVLAVDETQFRAVTLPQTFPNPPTEQALDSDTMLRQADLPGVLDTLAHFAELKPKVVARLNLTEADFLRAALPLDAFKVQARELPTGPPPASQANVPLIGGVYAIPEDTAPQTYKIVRVIHVGESNVVVITPMKTFAVPPTAAEFDRITHGQTIRVGARTFSMFVNRQATLLYRIPVTAAESKEAKRYRDFQEK